MLDYIHVFFVSVGSLVGTYIKKVTLPYFSASIQWDVRSCRLVGLGENFHAQIYRYIFDNTSA